MRRARGHQGVTAAATIDLKRGRHHRRKDSTSDLLIILGLNMLLLLAGAAVKMVAVDQSPASLAAFWASVYNVRLAAAAPPPPPGRRRPGAGDDTWLTGCSRCWRCSESHRQGAVLPVVGILATFC